MRAPPFRNPATSPKISRTGGPTSGLWPGRDLGARRFFSSSKQTQIAGPAAPNSDDIRATSTPSSRRRPGDDGTSTAYRTRTLLDDVQKRQTSTPSTRPNLSALESMSAPSARLRRDHHAATGPVLLPAPPGRERPTPLAARRRRHSFLPRRRGARLAWRSLLALADLEPTTLRTRPSVKLAARPGLRRVASGAVNARCWQGRLR